jgi:hypothetical protein
LIERIRPAGVRSHRSERKSQKFVHELALSPCPRLMRVKDGLRQRAPTRVPSHSAFGHVCRLAHRRVVGTFTVAVLISLTFFAELGKLG